jgi:hypothetical protein
VVLAPAADADVGADVLLLGRLQLLEQPRRGVQPDLVRTHRT